MGFKGRESGGAPEGGVQGVNGLPWRGFVPVGTGPEAIGMGSAIGDFSKVLVLDCCWVLFKA